MVQHKNRKLFKMHNLMVCDTVVNEFDVTYKVQHLFDPDRFVYFISDPTQLLKTLQYKFHYNPLNMVQYSIYGMKDTIYCGTIFQTYFIKIWNMGCI